MVMATFTRAQYDFVMPERYAASRPAAASGMSGPPLSRRPDTREAETVPDTRFQPLSESELQRLTDDELIDHIRKATAAGRPDAAHAALAILCWRRFDDIVRRVSMKVPRNLAEDVAMEAMLSAIRSAFDGVSIGEFVNWLNRIVSRRIADFHRDKEREPDTSLLPTEHQGEDDVWGEEPSEADRTGEVEVQSVIDECLAELSDTHRDVVERNVFDDLGAADTADQVNQAFPDLDPPMSEQNVHQIVSRFRRCLRKKLGESDDDQD